MESGWLLSLPLLHLPIVSDEVKQLQTWHPSPSCLSLHSFVTTLVKGRSSVRLGQESLLLTEGRMVLRATSPMLPREAGAGPTHGWLNSELI